MTMLQLSRVTKLLSAISTPPGPAARLREVRTYHYCMHFKEHHHARPQQTHGLQSAQSGVKRMAAVVSVREIYRYMPVHGYGPAAATQRRLLIP